MGSLIHLKEFVSSFGELLGALLVATGVYVLSKVKQHIENKDFFSVEKVVNRNMRLQAILHECRGFFDCDRAKLYQFHNGDYFLSGESVQKMSLTHFALKRGISSPVAGVSPYQNIPVSVLLPCLDKIKDAEHVMFSAVEDLPDEFVMKDAFRSTGCHAVAITAVRNQYGKMFGILVITWLDPQAKPRQMEDLREFAQSLGLEINYQSRK